MLISLKTKIIELRNKGYTYKQIINTLNCSKGTVSYHLNESSRKNSVIRSRRFKNNNPLKVKLDNFVRRKYTKSFRNKVHKTSKLIKLKLQTFFRNRKTKEYIMPEITIEQILEKFGTNPKCYLTGIPIDIDEPRTYNFDHIVPASKGGENTIENLGLCTKKVNTAKSDLTLDEFFDLCKNVLEYNGFNVTKK